jgi:hypothetical protein
MTRNRHYAFGDTEPSGIDPDLDLGDGRDHPSQPITAKAKQVLPAIIYAMQALAYWGDTPIVVVRIEDTRSAKPEHRCFRDARRAVQYAAEAASRLRLPIVRRSAAMYHVPYLYQWGRRDRYRDDWGQVTIDVADAATGERYGGRLPRIQRDVLVGVDC